MSEEALGSTLTVPVQFLSHYDVLLFLLNGLQGAGQMFNFKLDGQHFSFKV
jgi:hypothetical protein